MTEETPQDVQTPKAAPVAKRKRRKAAGAAGTSTVAKRRAAKAAALAIEPPQIIVRPLAPPAKAKKRHYGLLIAFLIVVLAPVALGTYYMYTHAQDRYASTVGFTVRTEDSASASDLIGGLGSIMGSSGGHDADILYEYIRSQEMVAAIDARLDLREMYSRHHASDPLLTLAPGAKIEDLTDYWGSMLRVAYDSGSGLMELRVLAFEPDEAKAIAEAIFDESSTMINALSAQAREDATRYASEDLAKAEERLRAAREALTTFRMANEIVDPSADIQGQMGLLNTLQAQLAAALIDFDLIASSTQDSDPRVAQAQRRIDVIQQRINDERQKFGAEGQGPGGGTYASTIASFESLTADREFAEQAYVAARTAYDASLAEAQRKSRYLAAYIRPTLAEQSEFPQRLLIVGVIALFSFLFWAIGSLVYYALRDRR